MQEPAKEQVSSRELRRALFSILPYISLPMFLAVVDQTMVATALPAIIGDLGGAQYSSLLVAGYVCASAVMTPVYGQLGDRYGRIKLMRIALAFFAFSSLLCTVAISIEFLLGARILQGMGAGGLMALSQALIGERVAPRQRGRMQGYLATIIVTSSALGPLIGGFMAQYIGWRSIFVGSTLLALAALLATMRVPNQHSPYEGRLRFDVGGMLLFASLVITVLTALQIAQHPGEVAPYWLWALLGALSVSLLSLLVRRERRASRPLLPPDLMAIPAVWRCNLMTFSFAAALVSLMTFLPIFMRIGFGTSPSMAGMHLLPAVIGVGIGASTTGYLMTRTGHTTIWPKIGLTIAGTLLTILAASLHMLDAWQVSWLAAVAVVFLGTVMSVVQVTVQVAAGPTRLGIAAATIQLSRTLGAAFGTALFGTVLFAVLNAMGPETYDTFVRLLTELPDPTIIHDPSLHNSILVAFRLAFTLPAIFAIAALGFAWSIPIHRLDG